MRKRAEIFRSELFFLLRYAARWLSFCAVRKQIRSRVRRITEERGASEGVYKRLWWKIEHEKIKLNITNMPYWHIIKVEHIRLCTNSSVLCWSFLLSLSPSAESPARRSIVHAARMQNISHTVAIAVASSPSSCAHFPCVSWYEKNVCMFRMTIEERSDGERNIDNCRGWSKQNGRGGQANNWTMKYIHAVHHRTTTRSNRKKKHSRSRRASSGVRSKRKKECTQHR